MAVAKKKPAPPARIELKKEDTVKVITGRDKGKTGRVLQVDRDTGTHPGGARRHDQAPHAPQSRRSRSRAASRSAKAPSPLSNVMIVCPGCNKAVRIKHHVDHVAGGKIAAHARLPQVRADVSDKK